MLPRPQRLHTDRDIRRVLRLGRRYQGTVLTLRALPTKAATHRFAFVVGKTVAKKANRRNLLKRRLRMIAKNLHLPSPYFDLVVVARPAAKDQSHSILRHEFISLIDLATNENHRRRLH